jgi:hypothetical protein
MENAVGIPSRKGKSSAVTEHECFVTDWNNAARMATQDALGYPEKF